MATLEDTNVQDFLKAYGINLSYDADAPEDRKRELDNFFNDAYGRRYELWARTPQTVRNYYMGRVPEEILSYVSTSDETELRIMSNNPGATKAELEEKVREAYYERPEDKVLETTSTFAAAVAVGYTVAAAHDLANERMFRDSLRDKALNNTMTEEEKHLWRQSREKTKEVILQHVMEKAPERALVYLLIKSNRGEMRPEELMPRIADLIQRIETNDRHEEMERLFSRKRFKNLYERLKPELKELVDGIRQSEFAHLKDARLNFKISENTDMPHDMAKFIEKNQDKHQTINHSLTKENLNNYISGMQQNQR